MNINRDICEIQINNFRKYHPRADYKSMPWVKIDANIFQDRVWVRLPHLSILFWVYLLCLCARKNTDSVSFQVRIAAVDVGLKPVQIRLMIDRMEQNQLLTVTSRTWDVQQTDAREDKNSKVKLSKEKGSTPNDLTVVDPPQEQIEKKVVEKKMHWLVDMWNEFGAKLPKAHTPVSTSRFKKIQTRIKDNPDPELWKTAIIRLSQSNFANGMNDRSWVATFDFLIQSDTLEKILEGKYDNRRTVTKLERHYIEQMQAIENGEL